MAIDWLRRSDHFDWLTPYLHARGLTRPIRFVMGAVALSLGLIPIEAVAVPEDHHGWPVMALFWLAGAGGIVAGCTWLADWPTKNRSLLLATVGSASMALWALTQANGYLSLLAGASLIISGGYFALFHSPRYVVGNLLIAAVVAVLGSWRVWLGGEYVHAVLACWLVLALNVIGPLAVLALIDAFGFDLPHADVDPLTGLLNRRGLRSHLTKHVVEADPSTYLRVVVIDLDDFKRVNDTHGHGVGDDTLQAVATILRDNVGRSAIACRIGGEEFLVADTAPSADAPTTSAERIRAQIAALPVQVTASIGISCARVSRDDYQRIEQLIRGADQAMYEAKRLGGNRIRWSGTGF